MALQLLAKIHSIQDAGTAVKKKFPQLLQGLGTLEGEYEIRLKPDATPVMSTSVLI